jgi:hypothetical protein
MKGYIPAVQTVARSVNTINYSWFENNGNTTLPISKPFQRFWPAVVTAMTTATATQNAN